MPSSSAAFSIGSMWRWICALLNSSSTLREKFSMPKPSTRKPARRMARQALLGHGIDAIGADELQVVRQRRRRCLAATMPSHSGRTRRSLVKTKMSS